MNNYKILENRPELSKEQLSMGMDFNKVKTNAAISKTAILKSIIIKCIVGIAIIGSGALVYKLSIPTEMKSNAITRLDTTIKTSAVVVDSAMNENENNKEKSSLPKNVAKQSSVVTNSISTMSIDSTKEIIISNKGNNTVAMAKEVIKEENKQVVDSMVQPIEIQIEKIATPKTSKVTRVKSCKIWKTTDFCNTPKSAKFATSLDCDLVEFDYIDCQAANQKSNLKVVWLTISVNEKSTLQIESELKNVKLIKTNGKTECPVMLYLSGDHQFFGANFKAKKLTVHYNKQIDVFMFFNNAELGDKISIHNFIEALIEQ